MATADDAQKVVDELKQAFLSEEAARLQETRGGLESALGLARAQREAALGEFDIQGTEIQQQYGRALTDVEKSTDRRIGEQLARASSAGLGRYSVTGKRTANIAEAGVRSVGELTQDRANQLARISLQKAITGKEFGIQISEYEGQLATTPSEARLSASQLGILQEVKQAQQDYDLAIQRFEYDKSNDSAMAAERAQARLDAAKQQEFENSISTQQLAISRSNASVNRGTQTERDRGTAQTIINAASKLRANPNSRAAQTLATDTAYQLISELGANAVEYLPLLDQLVLRESDRSNLAAIKVELNDPELGSLINLDASLGDPIQASQGFDFRQ